MANPGTHPPRDLRTLVKKLIRTCGSVNAAAKRLRLSRDATSNLAKGNPVQAGTIALARAALASGAGGSP